MRARNLKPGFFKNPELADAGPIAQLLFAGLWLMADKEGRLKDQPRVIKAELFPYYEVDVNGELTVIERLGHIHRYVADGIAVIEVCNFKKHQSPHHTEKGSDLPPCNCENTSNSSVREIHGEVTVKSPLDDGGNPSDSLIPDSLIQVREPVAIAPALIAGLDLDAWSRWLEYRRSIGKPIKPPSIEAAQRKLAKLGSGQSASIDDSIANGYQGFFPPKGNGRTAGRVTEWE